MRDQHRSAVVKALGVGALVVAVSGTADAAVNSISGAQLQDRSVAGKKLKLDTVTGKEVKEATLSGVTLANRKLKIYRVARRLSSTGANAWAPVALVPGIGTFEANCSSSGNHFTLRLTATQGTPVHYSYTQATDGTTATGASRIADGSSAQLPTVSNSGSDGAFQVAATFTNDQVTTSVQVSLGGVTAVDGASACAYVFTATAG